MFCNKETCVSGFLYPVLKSKRCITSIHLLRLASHCQESFRNGVTLLLIKEGISLTRDGCSSRLGRLVEKLLLDNWIFIIHSL